MIAQVIVDNRASKTDKPFTYLVKEELIPDIDVGIRVLVPFGRGNRLIKGIVIKIEEYNSDISALKYVEELLDDRPIIPKSLMKLGLWLKEYYLCSYLDALHTVMPPGDFKEVTTYISLNKKYTSNEYEILNENENKIVEYLKTKGKCTIKDIKIDLNIKNPRVNIKSLEQKNIIFTELEIGTKVNAKYGKYVYLKGENEGLEKIIERLDKRAIKQIEIVKYLFNKSEVPLKNVLMDVSTTLSTVKALERKGIVQLTEKEVLRNPIKEDIIPYNKFELTDEQQICVDSIFNSIIDKNNKKNNKFLIHGVTGSGKTEVYLQLIEKTIKLNKQVIVLVPEISLTPQTLDRFVGRFGNNVAVLHSRLSYGERFDEWRRIKEGKVQIVVGARSAIFAPFENLGLIVIDEEHETSYKSSSNPKYNTIEVAEKRCELEGACLVLGTATPSIETYFRAENGEINLLTLKKRVNDKKLPAMKIVDMRDELDKGNKSVLSLELYKAIEDNLKNKGQIILFLNRRGYSTFVSCRKCGYVVKCKNCDISLTYHITDNKLKCHYCGLTVNPPITCPKCKSKYIKYFGIGTQKVEEIIKKYFPEARVARMDIDTTTKKGSHERILNKMKKGQIDILIGTQMISKGLDFPRVTLVGIIAADTSLNLPDYRSSERTFQLLTQVGGRAGRGEFEGQVIVQTYNPDHYSIQLAQNHDYINFYRKEILLRKEFQYPPFVKLINITIIGPDEKKVINRAKNTYTCIVGYLKSLGKNDIISSIYGPNPAPLGKIKNNYRWQIVVKSPDDALNMLKDVINRVCIDNEDIKQYKDIRYSIDINPNSIM